MMVDSEKTTKQKFLKNKLKKRKKRSAEKGQDEEPPPKTSRLNYPEKESKEQLPELENRNLGVNFEEGYPWRNLQLILSLQNKNLDIPTSVSFSSLLPAVKLAHRCTYKMLIAQFHWH